MIEIVLEYRLLKTCVIIYKACSFETIFIWVHVVLNISIWWLILNSLMGL